MHRRQCGIRAAGRFEKLGTPDTKKGRHFAVIEVETTGDPGRIRTCDHQLRRLEQFVISPIKSTYHLGTADAE